MGKNRGFTLIELMVTIAVLAIIAMFAAPSFGNMMNKQKLDGAVRELALSINQAKSQAALMKKSVGLCLNRTQTDDDFNKDECAQATIPEYTATSGSPPAPVLSSLQKDEILKSRIISVQIDPAITIESSSAVAILFNDIGSAPTSQSFNFCVAGQLKNVEVTRLGNINKTSGLC